MPINNKFLKCAIPHIIYWDCNMLRSSWDYLQGVYIKQAHKITDDIHHRKPPSKTGWPTLNMMSFPPVLRLVLDDTKQW